MLILREEAQMASGMHMNGMRESAEEADFIHNTRNVQGFLDSSKAIQLE